MIKKLDDEIELYPNGRLKRRKRYKGSRVVQNQGYWKERSSGGSGSSGGFDNGWVSFGAINNLDGSIKVYIGDYLDLGTSQSGPVSSVELYMCDNTVTSYEEAMNNYISMQRTSSVSNDLVRFDFPSSVVGNGALYNWFTVLRYSNSGGWYSWIAIYNWRTPYALPTPTGLQVLYYGTGDYIFSANSNYPKAYQWMEVDTSDTDFPTYTAYERNYFYRVCCNKSEDVNWRMAEAFDNYPLHRWTKPTVTIKASFTAGGSPYQSTMIPKLQAVISNINSAISGSGVQLQYNSTISDQDADILVKFGTHEEFGFGTPNDGYIIEGTWTSDYNPDGSIRKSNVQIAVVPYMVQVQAIILEEVTQAMGTGNDGDEYEISAWFQVPHRNRPTLLTNVDVKIMQMLYSRGLPVGELPQVVVKRINCMGITGHAGGAHLKPEWFKPGKEYRVRTWAVNPSGYYADDFSPPSEWVHFTPAFPNFRWTYEGYSYTGSTPLIIPGGRKVIGPGRGFYLTATEWTSFQEAINERRWAKGLSMFSFFNGFNGLGSFTRAVSDTDFMYYFFNQARNAINEMAPRVAVPPAKNSGDVIRAEDINGLMDSLNSI